jgi:hypothetical protein
MAQNYPQRYYFSYLWHQLALHNNLQKAVMQFLKSQDRKVIREEDVESFKQYINQQVKEICNQHQRCRPVVCEWWKNHRDEDDEQLSLNTSICSFSLLSTKVDDPKPFFKS